MSVSASVSAIRITYFQAEKISNVSGGHSAAQRQSSPYRITTYRGPELGLVGCMQAVVHKLYETDIFEAANQDEQSMPGNSLLQKFKQYCRQC